MPLPENAQTTILANQKLIDTATEKPYLIDCYYSQPNDRHDK